MRVSSARANFLAPIVAIGIVAAASDLSIADQEPDLEVISVAGVDFGRLAVGCSIVNLKFGGEIYAKRPRRPPQPASNATFRCNGPRHDPEPCEVTIQPDGSFKGLVTAWDHTYVTTKKSRGSEKVRHTRGRAWVTVHVPGCREKRLTVDREWRDRRIVLKCDKDE